MAWSGSNFVRALGATQWANDAAANVGIEAAIHDTQDNDLATGIDNCINKNGANTPTANLGMGGYKHTNVANASAGTEYMAFGQISNGTTTVNVGAVTSTGVTVAAAGAASVKSYRYSADTSPAALTLGKSRGATVGTPVIVASGDELGSIQFEGSNGTFFETGASIAVQVDGTPGSSADMPGRIVFSTSADGSASPTERMRIDSAGRVGIGNAPTKDFSVDKTVNGDVLIHAFNRSNGTAARAGLLFGNDTSAEVGSIVLTSSTYTGSTNNLRYTNAGSGGGHIFIAGAATRMIIAGTGVVTMGAYGAGTATFSAAGVISSASDGRLKNQDGQIENAQEKIEALEPCYWYWKPDVAESFGTQRELGFIAQNVNEALGEEAAPTPDEGRPWGYYDRSVLAVSVQALKDLFAKIESLEARVSALE